MILTVFLAVNAVGFAAWILGSVFRLRGVAAIGGVIIVGTGIAVLAGGLEYQSGQVRDMHYENGNTSNNPDTVDVSYQYQQASLPQQYSLGFLVVLLGSLGLFRGLDPD